MEQIPSPIITQEHAKLIYNCYAEINKSENFLNVLTDKKKIKEPDELTSYLRDRDHPEGYYTLGHTIGSSSRGIAAVSPELTIKIVKAHLATLRKKLSSLIGATIAKAEAE